MPTWHSSTHFYDVEFVGCVTVVDTKPGVAVGHLRHNHDRMSGWVIHLGWRLTSLFLRLWFVIVLQFGTFFLFVFHYVFRSLHLVSRLPTIYNTRQINLLNLLHTIKAQQASFTWPTRLYATPTQNATLPWLSMKIPREDKQSSRTSHSRFLNSFRELINRRNLRHTQQTVRILAEGMFYCFGDGNNSHVYKVNSQLSIIFVLLDLNLSAFWPTVPVRVTSIVVCAVCPSRAMAI